MTSKNSQKFYRIYTSKPWELAKTLFLVLSWIVLGIHLEIVGPTLDVLAKQTNVDYSGISSILVTRGCGYIVGNIAGGLVQNIVKKHPEGLLSVSFLVAAFVVLITPYITSIWILSGISLFHGISQGVTDIGGTNLMLSMWGDYVSAPLNIVHLGFGLGAVAANLIVKPFLGEDTTIDLSSNSSKASLESSNGDTVPIMRSESNIRYPYSIAASLCVVIAVGHFLLSLYEYRTKKRSLQDRPINYTSVANGNNDEKQTTETVEKKKYSQYSPRSFGNGDLQYGLVMSIIWTFYMFFVSGNDLSFGKFFFAFLKSPEFKISAKGANFAMIFYWSSYTLGRLICAAATAFVSVHFALGCLWGCGVILAVAWYILIWVVELTSTNLFILGGLTGLVFSPTFPLSFGFINQRLNVNPFLLSIFLCGSGSGGMLFQKIGGIVLDTNRKHFPTLLMICVALTSTLFTIASIISTRHRKSLKPEEKSDEMTDNNNVLMINEDEQMEAYLKKNEEDQ